MSSDPFSHKENVVCRVCEKKMLARNYKRHLIDHHKGENPSDLRGKTQRPVHQFFAPRNFKRKKVDDDEEEDPDNDEKEPDNPDKIVTVSEMDVDDATGDDLPDLEYTGARTTNEAVFVPEPVSSNQIVVEEIDENNNNDDLSLTNNVPAEATSNEEVDNLIDNERNISGKSMVDVDRVAKKFDLMKVQMEKMKKEVCRTIAEWTEAVDTNIKKADKVSEEDEKEEGEEVITKDQMKKCRTVVDLIEAFPLLYNRDRGIMICEECVEVEDVDSKEVKVKSGLFVYENDQFEGQEKLTPSIQKSEEAHNLSSIEFQP